MARISLGECIEEGILGGSQIRLGKLSGCKASLTSVEERERRLGASFPECHAFQGRFSEATRVSRPKSAIRGAQVHQDQKNYFCYTPLMSGSSLWETWPLCMVMHLRTLVETVTDYTC